MDYLVHELVLLLTMVYLGYVDKFTLKLILKTISEIPDVYQINSSTLPQLKVTLITF